MELKKLQKLRQEPESAILEFKREYKLKKNAVPQGAKPQSWHKFIEYQSNEFVRDILSLLELLYRIKSMSYK